MNNWTRSSKCSSGTCVEVNTGANAVRVRDSKDPQSPVLSFTADEWRAFMAGAKAGEFDV